MSRKYLITENEFESIRVEGRDLVATRDNGTLVNFGQVVPDISPEMQQMLDDTVEARDQAELFAANTVELQDAAIAQAINTPGSETQTLLNDTIVAPAKASTIKRRPRTGLLDFKVFTGSPYQPMSVGDDGYIYGGRLDGSNMPIRTLDGFETVDTTARSFSSQGDSKVLRAVWKTAEGWVAVTSDNSTSDQGTIWYTTDWAYTDWQRKIDCGFINTISISRPTPKKDGSGTVMLIGEYGNADSRKLYLTEDGGQNWREVFTHTRKPGGTANNTHIHHASYDPETGRIWLSAGDGVNNWFGYSDDMGTTWVDVPAEGAGPEDAGTIYNHPTVLTPTSYGIVTTPDGSRGSVGVWMVDKDTGRVTIAHEVAREEPYRHWARAPWAQDGDEIYIMFPPDQIAAEVEEVIIAGSSDGGRSWYTLYRLPVDKSVDLFFYGLVGPDPQGRLWMMARRNGENILYWAQKPDWEDVALGGVLETERPTGVLLRDPSLENIVNSDVETTLGVVNIPEKFVRDGDIIRVKAFGTVLNDSGASTDLIFKGRVRGVTPISTGNFTVESSALLRKWYFRMDLHVRGDFITLAESSMLVSRPSGASMPMGTDISGAGSATLNESTQSKCPVEIRATSTVADPDVQVTTLDVFAELIRRT